MVRTGKSREQRSLGRLSSDRQWQQQLKETADSRCGMMRAFPNWTRLINPSIEQGSTMIYLNEQIELFARIIRRTSFQVTRKLPVLPLENSLLDHLWTAECSPNRCHRSSTRTESLSFVEWTALDSSRSEWRCWTIRWLLSILPPPRAVSAMICVVSTGTCAYTMARREPKWTQTIHWSTDHFEDVSEMNVVFFARLDFQCCRIDQSKGDMDVRAQRRIDEIRIQNRCIGVTVDRPVGIIADQPHF